MNNPTAMMMQPMVSTTTVLLLFVATLIAPSMALSADCSSCDHSTTAPVYYGCIGDSAYVTYDKVNKVNCGEALSLNQTLSIPWFYYPDADNETLYTLLMMDTTGIDPAVGTQPPFLPFPIIHYGAMNIPGDVLIDGMKMDKFHFDKTGVRVTPFLPYQYPRPSDDLSKVQPGITPPDINTRAFNYEFILGEQSYERSEPNMDKNTNWEFIGFLQKTIVGGKPTASTYISTGYCVKDVQGDIMTSDCPVPAETGSKLGRVPAHVADSSLNENTGSVSDGGASSIGKIGESASNGSGSTSGDANTSGDAKTSGDANSSADSNSSSGASTSGDAISSGTDSGDATTLSSASARYGRPSTAAAVVMSCVVGRMSGFIGV